MGWDQTTGREDVERFLLRELGINLDNLVAEAIKARLAEKKLGVVVSEDTSRHEGDGLCEEFHPQVVKFSDGRTFVEALTETDRGDDWGNDYFSFVEAGKPFEVTRNEYHYDGNDPHTTKEIVPGVTYSLEEIRERGGEFGDAIADFFTEQGIDSISFEPGDEDDAGSAGC